MTRKSDLPLLLLDNSSVMTAMNQGEYKCTNLSFEEARSILELYGDDVICGFTNPAIESIIFEHGASAAGIIRTRASGTCGPTRTPSRSSSM